MALKTLRELFARIIAHRGGSSLDAAKTLDAPTYDWASRLSDLTDSPFIARGVVTANTSLTAFDTAGINNDGIIDYAEGEIVFPAAQTAKAENGPYVVGEVEPNTGLAPLTRPAWWSAASTQKIGNECRMSGGGTVFANTVWAAMGVNANPSAVVDTEDFGWWPRSVTRDATLTAGKTAAITNIPVRNANSQIIVGRKTPNTTAATIQYAVDSATRVDGALGSAVSFIVQAEIAAGTINIADVSGVQYTVINQP